MATSDTTRAYDWNAQLADVRARTLVLEANRAEDRKAFAELGKKIDKLLFGMIAILAGIATELLR